MFADGLTEEEILGLLLSLKLNQSDFIFWLVDIRRMRAFLRKIFWKSSNKPFWKVQKVIP